MTPLDEPSGQELESNVSVLSFEQFSDRRKGPPRYLNFFMHFEEGMGAAYREKDYYKRFEAENPKMAADLCEKIQARDRSLPTSKSLKGYDVDLYEAYKVMRSYGASDAELFG